MDTTTRLLFAGVAPVAIATPSPTVLLALANGSHYGVRRSVPGMLGAVTSDFVLVGTVALGLGAAYLGWLGWRRLRSQGGFDLPVNGAVSTQASARAIIEPTP